MSVYFQPTAAEHSQGENVPTGFPPITLTAIPGSHNFPTATLPGALLLASSFPSEPQGFLQREHYPCLSLQAPFLFSGCNGFLIFFYDF